MQGHNTLEHLHHPFQHNESTTGVRGIIVVSVRQECVMCKYRRVRRQECVFYVMHLVDTGHVLSWIYCG